MRSTFLQVFTLAFVAGAATMPGQKQEGPRVPYVSDHPADPALAKSFDQFRARIGLVPNMVLVTANAPLLNAAMSGFAQATRSGFKVDRHYLELSILQTVLLQGGRYQYVHHLGAARSCGVSDAQIHALPHWHASNLFDPKERAVLAYADGMLEKKGPDDATFAHLASFFSSQEIVELSLMNGVYSMESLYSKALRVPVEPGFDSGKAPGGC